MTAHATRFRFSFVAAQLLSWLVLAWALGPRVAQAQAPGWQAVLTLGTPAGASSAVNATATDASGNVYLAGFFTNTVQVGSFSLTSAGGNDAFVACWSPATNTFLWVQRAGGSGSDLANAIAVSGSSVYVAGAFAGTATFGSTTLSTAILSEAYVAKLTVAGSTPTWAWVQRTAGTNSVSAYRLAVSGPAVYLVGTFDTTVAFGTTSYTSQGGSDGYLARLTDGGSSATWAWAMRLGSPQGDALTALVVNPAGIYVAGTFGGYALFGSGSIFLTGVLGGTGVCVAKIIDLGTAPAIGWTQKAESYYGGFHQATALAVRGTEVFVGGNTEGGIKFDNLGPYYAVGRTDMYVAKLTETANGPQWAWALLAGGTGYDYLSALAATSAGVYAAGQYGSMGGTAPTVFGSVSLPTNYGYDGFLAYLTEAANAPSWQWAQAFASTSSDGVAELTLARNGTLYLSGFLGGRSTFGSTTVLAPGVSTGFVTGLSNAALASRQPAPLAGLHLYPTPAHGRATVQLPAGLGAGEATLTVLDNAGRAVRARTVALAAGSSQAEVDVAGLAPGVYALRVAVGECRGTARLVVE